HVGIDLEGGGQVAGQGRAVEAHVQGADALVAVHAQVVEGEGEFPAVAVAGPAGDDVGQHRADAEPLGRVVLTAGRHQDVQGGRADVVHALGQEGQPVGEG